MGASLIPRLSCGGRVLSSEGGEASPPNLQPSLPNVACCVQCLYSTTTIISSAKISSDVIVCSKKNRPHGTCHGEVLEAQE